MSVIPEPLYLPDLVLHTSFSENSRCDLQIPEMWFTDPRTIQVKAQDVPAKFQTVHFMNCFKQWHHCGTSYVKSHKEYFEKDKTD